MPYKGQDRAILIQLEQSKRNIRSGSSSLAENLIKFSEFGMLLGSIQQERLDDGQGIIGAEMVQNIIIHGFFGL